MFDRFSDKSRQAVAKAHQEALRCGCREIGANHLILGLMQCNGSASKVLSALGASEPKSPIASMPLAEAAPTTGLKLPQSAAVQHAIQHAVEEARKLGHSAVLTEHLLLGLLDVSDPATQRMVIDCCIEPSVLRWKLLNSLQSRLESKPKQLYTAAADAMFVNSEEEARRMNLEYIGTEHILLSIVRCGVGIAPAVIRSLGISLDQLEEEVGQFVKKGPVPPPLGTKLQPTPRARHVVGFAIEQSRSDKRDRVNTGDFLVGLRRETGGIAVFVLMARGVSLEDIQRQIAIEGPAVNEV